MVGGAKWTGLRISETV